MIDEPPLIAPSVQVKPICDPVVIDGTLARFNGASGEVSMIAPLPSGEKAVEPTTLVAVTLAHTEVPQSMLNGAALSTLTGITQRLAVTIDALEPLQLIKS